MDKRKIYLTFDDGIEEGTADVLNVLEEEEVSATFFLTGLTTSRFLRNKPISGQDILLRIAHNHTIGNHSYSHCHGYYRSYYERGLLANAGGLRISPLEDFNRNENYICSLLNNMGTEYNFPRIARLPGRNTWISEKFNSFNGCPKIEQDTIGVAESFNSYGIRIYGWDIEWKMSFDFQKAINLLRNKLDKVPTVDYSDPDLVFPDFDRIAQEYSHFDRLTEPYDRLVDRIIDLTNKEVVVLLHDRAFRMSKGKGTVKGYWQEPLKLKKFIRSLKKLNYTFDTLDNYDEECIYS